MIPVLTDLKKDRGLMSEGYREKAQWIANDYQKNATNKISEILLFPDPKEKEIRLIEVVPNAIPSSEGMSPWYFSAHAPFNSPYGLAVAIIRPEEKQRLALPQNWGTWGDAVTLYPKKQSKVQRKA